MKFKSSLTRKRDWFGLVFALPWLIGVLLFFVSPLISGLGLSFSSVDFNKSAGGFSSVFVGFENYIDSFTKDEKFIQHLVKSIGDVFINVPICLVFSFFVAVLLKNKFHGNFLAKAVFFLPVILGTGLFLEVQSAGEAIQSVAIESSKQEGLDAMGMLQSINIVKILGSIGFPSEIINYITAPIDRIYTVISMSGIQIFIFLAGLNSINPSIYEAAHVEGASSWEGFWKITFPLVSPMIIVNIIYSLVDSFTASGNAVMSYIYNVAFSDFQYGLSNAMAWIYCAVMGVLISLSMLIISKKVVYQS